MKPGSKPELRNSARTGTNAAWNTYHVIHGLLGAVWDWFDKREIDKHLMAWLTFLITVKIVEWATHFVADHPDKPGLEVAAILAAVMVPWTPLQAKVIDWYFRARTATNGGPK